MKTSRNTNFLIHVLWLIVPELHCIRGQVFCYRTIRSSGVRSTDWSTSDSSPISEHKLGYSHDYSESGIQPQWPSITSSRDEGLYKSTPQSLPPVIARELESFLKLE